MRRRPLMNSVVMTINLVIIFILCFLLFSIIGGILSEKLISLLDKTISNKEEVYYYIYFGIKSLTNYLILFLSIIYATKYTFKYFVCYKDDFENVFKYSILGLVLLLVYNYYSMFNNLIKGLSDFNNEKIFANTESLKALWQNIESNTKIIFLIVNLIFSAAILIYAIKGKNKVLDKCDYRI